MANSSFKSCSFCGKGENMVNSMLSAAEVKIWEECVRYCYEMIFRHTSTKVRRKA